MATIEDVMMDKFRDGADWRTTLHLLTDAFTGADEITKQGREFCKQMGCAADFYEVESGTRLWIEKRHLELLSGRHWIGHEMCVTLARSGG